MVYLDLRKVKIQQDACNLINVGPCACLAGQIIRLCRDSRALPPQACALLSHSLCLHDRSISLCPVSYQTRIVISVLLTDQVCPWMASVWRWLCPYVAHEPSSFAWSRHVSQGQQ